MITQAEYDEKLEEYLTEQGPNPGGDQFGRMAWRIKTAKVFAAQMEEQYDLAHITTFPNVHFELKKNSTIGFDGQ